MDSMCGLTDKDFRTIDAYRKAYTVRERADYLQSHKMEYFVPAEKWLQTWESNKSMFLFKLFGENSLILEKPIYFERDLYNEIDCWGMSPTFMQFYEEVNDNLIKIYGNGNETYECWCTIKQLFFTSQLKSNRISGEYAGEEIVYPDGEVLKLIEGNKVSKLLGKVAAKLGCEKYEKFRLEHSEILNGRKTEGILCLSIHPMDYITMSDNECNWSSCMSWRQDGCYRMGTIEMMNSPYVVVAYIKDNKKDMRIENKENSISYSWNSKRWRSLYIVNNDIITNIKGYPYQLTDVDKTVIDWIAELARNNLNRKYIYSTIFDTDTYETKDFSISYSIHTKFMYNDYYCSNTHRVLASKDTINDEEYDISGPAICAWCGDIIRYDEEDETNAQIVICEACLPRITCAECGELFFEGEEAFHYYNGDYYCHRCWEYAFIIPINGTEIIPKDETKILYIIPAEYRSFVKKEVVELESLLVNEGIHLRYDPEKDLTDFLNDVSSVNVEDVHLARVWGKRVKYLYTDEVNDNILKYNIDTRGNTHPIDTSDGKLNRLGLACNAHYWHFNNFNYWFQYIDIIKTQAALKNNTLLISEIDDMIKSIKEVKLSGAYLPLVNGDWEDIEEDNKND